MDSLLANYASSDEEEDEQKPISSALSKTTSSSNSSTSSLFSSLPQPKSSSSSSSLFQSLPQPKQPSTNPSPLIDDEEARPQTSLKFSESAALFSSLPKPKSQIQQQPKKVVQFKPPIIPLPKPSELDDEDDIEDEEEERNRRRKLESSTQTPSVKSFLSSIPAPRNTATLGVQPSSGSGRRSIIEMEAPEPALAANTGGSAVESNVPVDRNAGDFVNYENYASYQYGTDQNVGSGYVMDGASYGNYGLGIDQSVGIQPEAGVPGTATSSYGSNDDAYASYGTYGDYVQYGNNWVDGSAATVPEVSGVSDNAVRFPGKRGRHEIPSEMIEVRQEELVKNRPREDQVKLTGIAFGPSYQQQQYMKSPSSLNSNWLEEGRKRKQKIHEKLNHPKTPTNKKQPLAILVWHCRCWCCSPAWEERSSHCSGDSAAEHWAEWYCAGWFMEEV